jgi:gamma-glutamyltranspeptidase/glutathione hydrolase
VSQAKQAGAKGRAELLELVATKAATALTDTRVRKAFTSLFGTVEGGLITPADLAAREDVQAKALVDQVECRTPWGSADEGRGGVGHAIVVGDSKGLFAALSYGEIVSGCELTPFETMVPMTAQPVLRGVTRVAPGTPIPRGDGLCIQRSAAGAICGASATLGDRVLQIQRVDEGKELMARDSRP